MTKKRPDPLKEIQNWVVSLREVVTTFLPSREGDPRWYGLESNNDPHHLRRCRTHGKQ